MTAPTVRLSELAAAIGVSRDTVLRHVKKGLIPAARLSARGHYRIPADMAARIVAKFAGGSNE